MRNMLVGICALFGAVVSTPTPAAEWALQAALGAGMREDTFTWNVASDLAGLASPNVLSELRWRGLRAWALHGSLRAMWRRWLLAGEAEYGHIGAGRAEDSDYARNNKALEWSRSVSDAGAGWLADAALGIGRVFSLGGGWTLTPWLGHMWHRQSLRMRRGVQVIARRVSLGGTITNPPPLGPFPGLDSTYDAEWWGPWWGAEMAWHHGSWVFALNARWMRGDYRAWADWNLRQDLAHPVSFRHRASAHGQVWRIRIARRIRWGEWAFIVSERRFLAGPGVDQSYDVQGRPSVAVRLNEVRWIAKAILLQVCISFGRETRLAP